MKLGYRPTQDEVEAQAAKLWGKDWKQVFIDMKADADAAIALRLDAARAEVVRKRRER